MKSILSYWNINLAVTALLLLLLLFYSWLWRFKWPWKFIYFFFAVLLLITCFFSPLQLLGSHYLFSAHMIIHVLLLLCAGPLLLVSLPKEFLSPFFIFLRRHPFISWITGVGIMWFWHIPAVFNSMMNAMHFGAGFLSFLEPFSLLLAGIIFSAPVLHSARENRLEVLSSVVYLFTACVGCSVLGILISFAQEGTYHHYLAMHDKYGINKIITGKWGITRRADQEIAGLIMWVPCCFVYVITAIVLLVEWMQEKNLQPSTSLNKN